MDDLLEGSATPQQISEAVKRELSQVKSMIKDLSPTSDKSQQSTVKQDRTLLPPPRKASGSPTVYNGSIFQHNFLERTKYFYSCRSAMK